MRKETKRAARARIRRQIVSLNRSLKDRAMSDGRFFTSGSHAQWRAEVEALERELAALAPVPRKPKPASFEADVRIAELAILPRAVGIPLPPPPPRSADRSRLEAMLRDLSEEMDRVRLCMRMVTDRQGQEISECLAAVSLAHNTLRDLKRAALEVCHGA